mmetsp:Transcript_28087/g.82634  ORF Transcript_28087/g.82634 Transcript_28087/m.82634 type:complete len:228 (-) Transcript_28087:355-1038(-)
MKTSNLSARGEVLVKGISFNIKNWDRPYPRMGDDANKSKSILSSLAAQKWVSRTMRPVGMETRGPTLVLCLPRKTGQDKATVHSQRRAALMYARAHHLHTSSKAHKQTQHSNHKTHLERPTHAGRQREHGQTRDEEHGHPPSEPRGSRGHEVGRGVPPPRSQHLHQAHNEEENDAPSQLGREGDVGRPEDLPEEDVGDGEVERSREFLGGLGRGGGASPGGDGKGRR